ncbi:hypothetical protein C8T65DRAFT_638596 [Cerioporus squamosus]|nr:hypothetical protein C8T65DRAFT_638596 [Cerioporus squamosus]
MLRELALGSVVGNPRSLAGTGDRWDCASDGAERLDLPEVDARFTEFCELLVVRDPDQRLHGPRATEHPFFDPIQELWDDIAALRYPPFTKVVWPEVEEDTKLDLRVYSGDVGDDSFERDDNVDLWLAGAEDIPFDVYQPVCEESSEPDNLVEPICVDAAATPEEPLQQLCASSTDGPIVYPSLSLLPTIPSLNSTSPGSVKTLHAKRESSDFLPCHPDPSGRKSAPLRRRPAVHDLRLVFQLSSDPSYAHSSLPTRSTARIGRKADLGMRKVAAKHAEPVAAPLSFEHEITIALLATMSGKNVDAPMATLRCPPSPAGAARRDKLKQRRGKAHSVLRALKGLVF